jgi:drug/metabolite transporter (DMT)-like permease
MASGTFSVSLNARMKKARFALSHLNLSSALRLSGKSRDLFWLLVLGALWGSSYLFIKVAVAEVPALTLVLGRLCLGTVIMWLLLLVTRQPLPRDLKQWRSFAVMGFLSGAVPWSLITWGEQYISSGLAALLQATMPLFTVMLALFLADDDRLTLWKALGVIIGFVGVIVLLLPDLAQGLQASLLGQLAIIASSVSYAGGAIFARSKLRGSPPLVATTGQLTSGLLFMLPVTLLLGRPLEGLPSPPALAGWLALTILGTVIAYLIYYKLIEWTSATFVSTVTYIIPVYGLFLGAIVLGESLTPTILLSLILVLIGVLLVRK